PAGMVSTLASGDTLRFPDLPVYSIYPYPSQIATDAGGNLFAAVTYDLVVDKISPSGAVSVFAGTSRLATVVASSVFSDPVGVAVDVQGNVFVADAKQNAIYKISSAGAI